MDLRTRMIKKLTNKDSLTKKAETNMDNDGSKFYVTEVWDEITGDYDHEDHESLSAARRHVLRVLESWQRNTNEEEADYHGVIDRHKYVIKVVYE